jgi:hypothetical protein
MAFLEAPVNLLEPLKWCREIARVVNLIMQGKTNNTGSVTLTANAATTVVTLAAGRLGNDTQIFFDPLTANAATQLYGGSMYITEANRDVLNSRFTITHTNNAQTDREFRYALIG